MKPKSSRKLDNKTHHKFSSSLYDFKDMSEALLDASNAVGVAENQNSCSEAHKGDCYDLTSLSETLNNIAKQKEKEKEKGIAAEVNRLGVKIKKPRPQFRIQIRTWDDIRARRPARARRSTPTEIAEVGLAKILKSIVDAIVKERYDLSYLFVKPVTKREAPHYLDIIKRPMDLSRIREMVKNKEYKTRDDFRYDMGQIAYNAHKYHHGRNPGIPLVADLLMEYCDHLLKENDARLTTAEAGIQIN